MALWKEDVDFLGDVTLMMTGSLDRSDLDMPRFKSEIGEVMAKYRKAALAEMQIGPLLQEMSAIGFRHGVPLPASLTLAAKALAQVQLATANLDPKLDPYDVAGKFFDARHDQTHGGRAGSQSTPLSVAKAEGTGRTSDRGHRISDRRSPRPEACRQFPANSLEEMVRLTGRRLTLSLTLRQVFLPAGSPPRRRQSAGWIPITFGIAAGLLTAGLVLDLIRGR